MKNIALYISIIFLTLTLGATGCAKKPSSGDKVLATVSNRSVTLRELDSRITKMPPYYQRIVEKNKKRYLDDIIVEMLLYEEAARIGLEKDREVRDLLAEAKKKIMITKFVKIKVEDNIKVPEEEMKAFYDLHKEEFKAPPLWRASHILVPTEKEAQDILDQLSKGASFEELAKAHSTDATAGRGGDIGYFKTGQLVPDFEKECLKLEVGQTSGILHTQFGYHIIKLTDKKEPVAESYEKVKRLIEGELKKKKRSELFDRLVSELKDKYNVKIEDDGLKLPAGGEPKSEKAN